jgi:hypothetical protein
MSPKVKKGLIIGGIVTVVSIIGIIIWQQSKKISNSAKGQDLSGFRHNDK